MNDLPDNLRDYAMALDDCGGLYVATSQFETADKCGPKPSAYTSSSKTMQASRASCNLATVAFSQKREATGRKYLARAAKEARAASDLDDDDRATIPSLQGWQAQFDSDFPMSVPYRGDTAFARTRCDRLPCWSSQDKGPRQSPS